MMTIRAADNLYNLAETWTGANVVVEHDAVERFSVGVSRLLSGLGEELAEGYWATVRRPLRALRWRLATVPLPIASTAIGTNSVSEIVIPRLRHCADIAPERVPQAEALISVLQELVDCSDNPLGHAVESSLEYTDDVILLTDGHAAERVADAFPGIRIMNTAQFMRTQADNVVAVGSSLRFPARLQQAPRAQCLTFVRYSWIADQVQDLGMLTGASTKPRQGFTAGPVRPPRDEERPIPPEELEPKFEWGAISRTARASAAEQWGEPVEAKLVLLASKQGVYLAAGDDSRTPVADVDEEITVSQEKIRRLTPGRFLVLRTAGDGDYVELYADQLLGLRAQGFRDVQERIRTRLGEHAQEHGLTRTAQRLRDYGSPIASEANVRNWIDPGHIVTRDIADFRAVCKLIGEDDPDALYAQMRELFGTHIRAGLEVRRLLVQELRRADIGALLRDGWGEYDVAEIEGEGSLLVTRITGIAPEIAQVPHGQLRKPFPIGDDLWLG
jgi:hypothetical protein